MDLQEYLKRFFEQLVGQSITASAIRNAVASAYSGEPPPGAIEVILAYAEAYGIDPKEELAELHAAREAAKAEASDIERREKIKTTLESAKQKLNELSEKAGTASMSELSEALMALNTETAGLVTSSASVNLFPTYADYDKAWGKKDSEDFMPSLFSKLGFPDGTLSYIGARTGRGKTSALINIGLDALFPLSENLQPRKVLFISLEDTQIEIIGRFILCLAYRDSTTECRDELLKIMTPWGEHEPAKTYGAWRQGKNLWSSDGTEIFIEAVAMAELKIKTAMESGKLIFFDGIEATSDSQIFAAIQNRAKRGDIVLFDYIQKIADKQSAQKTVLERTREGSDRLRQAAKRQECVIISGAQLNRAGQERGKDDTFNDADFKDCGDIEQDGFILIGLGRNASKTQTYYSVIKARRSKTTDIIFNVDFSGGYSYMEHTGEIYSKPIAPDHNKGKKKAPKVENKNEGVLG